jgi:hypothetical protein
MTRPLMIISLSVAAIMALGACATNALSGSEKIAETLNDTRVGEQVDKICFARGIDSFSEEKRNSVVLRRGVNDEYLVVTRGCFNLDMAQSLRLDRQTGCLRKGDFIRVYESAFGPQDDDRFAFDRCQVSEIYKWDDEAIEDDDAEEVASD